MPYSSARVAALPLINSLKHGGFWTVRGGKTKFCYFISIGASAKKRCTRSRIFRYGFPQDILSKGQKARKGGAYSAPPPPCFKGLINGHAAVAMNIPNLNSRFLYPQRSMI